jgi:hypothetical protein
MKIIQPCYWLIDKLPGLSVQEQYLLKENGIETTQDLLVKSQTPLQRLHLTIKRLCVATMQRKDLSPPVEQVKKWIEEANLIK